MGGGKDKRGRSRSPRRGFHDSRERDGRRGVESRRDGESLITRGGVLLEGLREGTTRTMVKAALRDFAVLSVRLPEGEGEPGEVFSAREATAEVVLAEDTARDVLSAYGPCGIETLRVFDTVVRVSALKPRRSEDGSKDSSGSSSVRRKRSRNFSHGTKEDSGREDRRCEDRRIIEPYSDDIYEGLHEGEGEGPRRDELWDRGEDHEASGWSARKADWLCGKCSTHNFSRRSECFTCGVPRGTDSQPVRRGDSPSSQLVSLVPTNVLMLQSLSVHSTADSIRTELKQFAPIKDVRLLTDPQSGASRCLAFVEFGSEQHAQHTLEKSSGRDGKVKIGSRLARVDFACLQPGVAGSSGGKQGQTLFTATGLETAQLVLEVQDQVQRQLHDQAVAQHMQAQAERISSATEQASRAREKQAEAAKAEEKDEESLAAIAAAKERKRKQAVEGQSQWPRVFEEAGAAYMFDTSSGYFFDSMASTYFDPKTKLYYKGGAWLQHRKEGNPPFAPAVAPGTVGGAGDGAGTAPQQVHSQEAQQQQQQIQQQQQQIDSPLVPIQQPGGQSDQQRESARAKAVVKAALKAKPISFAVKLGTGAVSGGGATGLGGSSSATGRPKQQQQQQQQQANPLLAEKKRTKDISKWNNRRDEPDTPSYKEQQQEKKRKQRLLEKEQRARMETVPGGGTVLSRGMAGTAAARPGQQQPPTQTQQVVACLLCQRGFASPEQLAKHEAKSKLHKENLKKARQR